MASNLNRTFNAADNPIFTGNAASVPNLHGLVRGTAPLDQVDPPFTKLKYGDFDFPGASTVEYEDMPVMDASGRNVFCRKLIVTVRFLVTHSYPLDDGRNGPYDSVQVPGLTYQTLSTDLPVEVLRSTLLRPRQEFWLEGLGYGRIHVYDRKKSRTVAKGITSVADIQNGPQPNETSFALQNLGALAKMATWQIVCHVPPFYTPFEAPGITNYPPTPGSEIAGGSQGILNVLPDSLSYKTTVSLRDGYTTRTIAGILKNYLGDSPSSIVGNPDNDNRPLMWRKQLDPVFRPLLGFRREFPMFEESEDRTELRFVIVDTEIASDNPYEVGITRISAPYTISANTPMLQWNVSLDATIEVAPNYPKLWGYVVFQRLYTDLAKRVYDNYYRSRPSRDLNASQTNQASASNIQDTGSGSKEYRYLSTDEISKTAQKPWSQLLGLKFNEDRYTREISCSALWTIIGVELEDILTATGFAQPGNTGATWDSWRSSLQRVLTAEGYQQVNPPIEYSVDFADPYEDPINLGNTNPAVKKPYNTVTLSLGDDVEEKARGGEPDSPEKPTKPQTPKLRPGEGYLKFENRIKVVANGSVVFHRFVDASQSNAPQEVGSDEGTTDYQYNPWLPFNPGLSNSLPSISVTPFGVTVQANRNRNYVILYGMAMRHTEPPRVPILRKVGIANAIETKDSVQETSVEAFPEVPDGKYTKVYSVWWCKKYYLDREPIGNVVVSDFAID